MLTNQELKEAVKTISANAAITNVGTEGDLEWNAFDHLTVRGIRYYVSATWSIAPDVGQYAEDENAIADATDWANPTVVMVDGAKVVS